MKTIAYKVDGVVTESYFGDVPFIPVIGDIIAGKHELDEHGFYTGRSIPCLVEDVIYSDDEITLVMKSLGKEYIVWSEYWSERNKV
jgi:hypothetical protein